MVKPFSLDLNIGAVSLCAPNARGGAPPPAAAAGDRSGYHASEESVLLGSVLAVRSVNPVSVCLVCFPPSSLVPFIHAAVAKLSVCEGPI